MAETRSKHSDRLLRTTDLTLAAYLHMQGHEPELVEMSGEDLKPGHPQGAWEFDETPALRDLVDEFEDHGALVEPQQFHTMVNKTRRDMFKFLGIGSSR